MPWLLDRPGATGELSRACRSPAQRAAGGDALVDLGREQLDYADGGGLQRAACLKPPSWSPERLSMCQPSRRAQPLLPRARRPWTPTTISSPAPGDAPADSTSITTSAAAAGMGQIPSPHGQLPLPPRPPTPGTRCASRRAPTESISTPAGPLSAYRTYDQQSELYRAFLVGYGAPANPPGGSCTNSGRQSTSRPPKCASVIDRPAVTAGRRSTAQASGGTLTTSAADRRHDGRRARTPVSNKPVVRLRVALAGTTTMPPISRREPRWATRSTLGSARPAPSRDVRGLLQDDDLGLRAAGTERMAAATARASHVLAHLPGLGRAPRGGSPRRSRRSPPAAGRQDAVVDVRRGDISGPRTDPQGGRRRVARRRPRWDRAQPLGERTNQRRSLATNRTSASRCCPSSEPSVCG